MTKRLLYRISAQVAGLWLLATVAAILFSIWADRPGLESRLLDTAFALFIPVLVLGFISFLTSVP